jgi:dTDP-4-dehydrorhamnose reductase
VRLLLLGANGMFGRDAAPVLRAAGHEVAGADLPEVDVADSASLGGFLDGHPAEVLLNAAAYTDVDGAESHREEAFRANAQGAEVAARLCRERGILLLHVSTDYVFPGEKPEGYLPDDAPGPALSVYGQSKLEGERAIREILGPRDSLICRTQWLYGRFRGNFVETMLRLARQQGRLRVVNDQWGVPTHTRELARQIAELLARNARGIAHTVGGGGPVTWWDWAREIVAREGLSCPVEPISWAALPRPARRPAHAWLRDGSTPPLPVRCWRDSLADYLEEREAAPPA